VYEVSYFTFGAIEETLFESIYARARQTYVKETF
jgi:hypothetical protein